MFVLALNTNSSQKPTTADPFIFSGSNPAATNNNNPTSDSKAAEAKPFIAAQTSINNNIKVPHSVAVNAAAYPKPTVNNSNNVNEHEVLITITPPAGSDRVPVDLCCVVDISGSMGSVATLKGDDGSVESHGLSVLDVVKHAVKTIVAALQPNDRLGLVVYNSVAEVVFPLTAMDEPAKEKVLKKLDALHADGTTNLWDGLENALEMLNPSSVTGVTDFRQKTCLLLTDGLANVSPPRGEMAMLRKYKDEHRQFSCAINTFGFGYNIDSGLLKDIAGEGEGMYSFIADSSMVGTAFVNCVSNMLVTMARNVSVSLEPQNGAKIIDGGLLGTFPVQQTSWGAVVNMCSLQYGQAKDLVVRMTVPPDTINGNKPFLTATVKYDVPGSQIPVESIAQLSLVGDTPTPEADVHRYRLAFTECIGKVLELMKENKMPQAQQLVQKFADEIRSLKSADDRLKALLADVTGQVSEAISKREWWERWGVHYLPSLMRAHLLQQCINFKDPGLQYYGGELFRKLRDIADALFVKLPPPKPSIPTYDRDGNLQTFSVRSMFTYYDPSRPCFSGCSLVCMANGSQMKVAELKKGDTVKTPNNGTATVVCVVKTVCSNGRAELVELGDGLLITPYHPVRIDNQWCFPHELGKVSEKACPAVYSFVLSAEHVMLINGVEGVTLGHNFTDNAVVAHPYLGSSAVIRDLEKMNGWDNGIIQLNDGCLVRDEVTGLICGFTNAGTSASA